MKTDADFVIINGKRYRRPKPALRIREDREKLEDPELALLEKMHNVASAISWIEGWKRDQRYTHSIPQILFELLKRTDEGASIIASIAYLESLGFIVKRKERGR
jgi:hypothetical protein